MPHKYWILGLLVVLLRCHDTVSEKDSSLTSELEELKKMILERTSSQQQHQRHTEPEKLTDTKQETSANNMHIKELLQVLQQRKPAAKDPRDRDSYQRRKFSQPTRTRELEQRKKCAAGKVKCPANRKCMPLSWLCDGYDDCKDFDEDPAVCMKYPCQEGFEHCPGGYKCIDAEWQCDGEEDCPDGGDESPSLCASKACPEGKYRCAQDDTCLDPEAFCNGSEDCADGSDEDVNVCKNVPCPAGRQRCPGGAKCIHPTWECDGEEDCEDGYDESEGLCENKVCGDDRIKCPSVSGSYLCLFKDSMCDGTSTCYDGWDEKPENCGSLECGEGRLRCSDGTCVSLYAYCGGWAKCKGKLYEIPNCADFFIHETYRSLMKKVLDVTDEDKRERLLKKLLETKVK